MKQISDAQVASVISVLENVVSFLDTSVSSRFGELQAFLGTNVLGALLPAGTVPASEEDLTLTQLREDDLTNVIDILSGLSEVTIPPTEDNTCAELIIAINNLVNNTTTIRNIIKVELESNNTNIISPINTNVNNSRETILLEIYQYFTTLIGDISTLSSTVNNIRFDTTYIRTEVDSIFTRTTEILQRIEDTRIELKQTADRVIQIWECIHTPESTVDNPVCRPSTGGGGDVDFTAVITEIQTCCERLSGEIEIVRVQLNTRFNELNQVVLNRTSTIIDNTSAIGNLLNIVNTKVVSIQNTVNNIETIIPDIDLPEDIVNKITEINNVTNETNNVVTNNNTSIQNINNNLFNISNQITNLGDVTNNIQNTTNNIYNTTSGCSIDMGLGTFYPCGSPTDLTPVLTAIKDLKEDLFETISTEWNIYDCDKLLLESIPMSGNFISIIPDFIRGLGVKLDNLQTIACKSSECMPIVIEPNDLPNNFIKETQLYITWESDSGSRWHTTVWNFNPAILNKLKTDSWTDADWENYFNIEINRGNKQSKAFVHLDMRYTNSKNKGIPFYLSSESECIKVADWIQTKIVLSNIDYGVKPMNNIKNHPIYATTYIHNVVIQEYVDGNKTTDTFCVKNPNI